MTATYKQALLEFRIKFCLQAVADAGGDVCRAARTTGIHRNTLSRMLHAGGYQAWQLRRDCRKPKAGAR